MLVTHKKLKCFSFYFIFILSFYCCLWNRPLRNKKKMLMIISPSFGIFKPGPQILFLPPIKRWKLEGLLQKLWGILWEVPLRWGGCHAGEATWKNSSWWFQLRLAFLPLPMKHHVTGIGLGPSISAHLPSEYPWVTSIKVTWKSRITHLNAAKLLL